MRPTVANVTGAKLIVMSAKFSIARRRRRHISYSHSQLQHLKMAGIVFGASLAFGTANAIVLPGGFGMIAARYSCMAQMMLASVPLRYPKLFTLLLSITLHDKDQGEFLFESVCITMPRMTKQVLQEITSHLISFPTTAGNRAAVDELYAYVESQLDLPQFACSYFERAGGRSQLIHSRDADPLKPALLINGHIDVVPGDAQQFQSVIDGDKVIGRGAADMKGGAAAAIAAYRQLHEKQANLNVALLFTADEEVGGANGAGYLVEEGLRPGFVVVVDGPQSDAFKITTKAKGGLWLKIEATGKSGHASRPWLADSAMRKVLEALRVIEKSIGPLQPDDWASTCSTAFIKTPNETPNVIPDHAEAVLDIRFTEKTAPNAEHLLANLKERLPEVRLTSLTNVSLLQTDENHPLVQSFQKSASEVTKEAVPFTFNHAASDARYFGEHAIPTVVMGVIGDNWHSQNEWASLASIEQLAHVLVHFAEENQDSFKRTGG